MDQIPSDARPIPDFSGYMIDMSGAVWSNKVRGSHIGTTRPWWRMKLKLSVFGYLCCNLYRVPNKPERRFIHRLMLAAFVGPPPAGLNALHRDDNKLNNSLDNLYYGTCAQNVADAMRNGGMKVGEESNRAKLTNRQVIEIRRRHATGESRRAIADDFGITPHYVSRITCGEIWRHV